MARNFKDKQRFQRRRLRTEVALPFTRINYIILALGVLVVILGFIAMAEGSVKGTMPLVVAPILLVIGYCIIIPIGIMYRKRQATPTTAGQEGVKKEAATKPVR